jgi:hypothetical protein
MKQDVWTYGTTVVRSLNWLVVVFVKNEFKKATIRATAAAGMQAFQITARQPGPEP